MKSLNDPHVLAGPAGNNASGHDETYWTGKLTVAGKPSISVHLEHAATFRNPGEAYAAGAKHKGLARFRAVRPMYRKHHDGFITRWWIGD